MPFARGGNWSAGEGHLSQTVAFVFPPRREGKHAPKKASVFGSSVNQQQVGLCVASWSPVWRELIPSAVAGGAPTPSPRLLPLLFWALEPRLPPLAVVFGNSMWKRLCRGPLRWEEPEKSFAVMIRSPTGLHGVASPRPGAQLLRGL